MAIANNPSLLLSIICLFGISLTEAINGGFTVELIHRASAKSPFYTKATPFQQVNNALRRSIKRAKHFYPEADDDDQSSESEIIPIGENIRGEYIMAYSLGTPPFTIFGIADTGSDLVWSQCLPCQSCYNQTTPLFDPSKSNTFKNIPCSSKQCRSVQPSVTRTSCDHSNFCQYDITYLDYSTSTGDIVSDTLTLASTSGRPVAFPNTVFGCGYSNGGKFSDQTSGIVGLGGGSVSLVSQMGSSIDGKFSYCLVPPFSNNASSKLDFGQNAVVSGPGTVSTPMVSKGLTFYYLTLEGMSVGAKRLEFIPGDSISDKKVVVEGNIVIDSGTTLTLLPEDFYYKLESEVATQIKLERANFPGGFLRLCYRSLSETIEAPIITAHFRGADVTLSPLNTFVKVSEDEFCFAFRSVSSGAIFGNLAQINYLVGYDLHNKLVSFKPTDCTKL